MPRFQTLLLGNVKKKLNYFYEIFFEGKNYATLASLKFGSDDWQKMRIMIFFFGKCSKIKF